MMVGAADTGPPVLPEASDTTVCTRKLASPPLTRPEMRQQLEKNTVKGPGLVPAYTWSMVNCRMSYRVFATSVPVPMLGPVFEYVCPSPKLSVTLLTLVAAQPWVTTNRTLRGARTGSGIDHVIVPKRKWLASATALMNVTHRAASSGSMRRNHVGFMGSSTSPLAATSWAPRHMKWRWRSGATAHPYRRIAPTLHELGPLCRAPAQRRAPCGGLRPCPRRGRAAGPRDAPGAPPGRSPCGWSRARRRPRSRSAWPRGRARPSRRRSCR